MAYMINTEKCVGCGACRWVCLFGVPAPTDTDASKYVIEKEKCVGCGQCENICPNNAIEPLPDHQTGNGYPRKLRRLYRMPAYLSRKGAFR